MNKFLANAISIAVAGLLLTAPVVAQQPGASPGGPPAAGGPGGGPGGQRGYGGGPGMMMGPGMMGMSGRGGMSGLCDPRAAGMAEWRVERIERLITPTEAQRAALNELQKASVKAAEAVAAACPREFPGNASARMELMEKRMEALLAAIKTVRPAFAAFYATLTDEQKKRVDSGGPRRWGWRNWRG